MAAWFKSTASLPWTGDICWCSGVLDQRWLAMELMPRDPRLISEQWPCCEPPSVDLINVMTWRIRVVLGYCMQLALLLLSSTLRHLLLLLCVIKPDRLAHVEVVIVIYLECFNHVLSNRDIHKWLCIWVIDHFWPIVEFLRISSELWLRVLLLVCASLLVWFVNIHGMIVIWNITLVCIPIIKELRHMRHLHPSLLSTKLRNARILSLRLAQMWVWHLLLHKAKWVVFAFWAARRPRSIWTLLDNSLQRIVWLSAVACIARIDIWVLLHYAELWPTFAWRSRRRFLIQDRSLAFVFWI